MLKTLVSDVSVICLSISGVKCTFTCHDLLNELDNKYNVMIINALSGGGRGSIYMNMYILSH